MRHPCGARSALNLPCVHVREEICPSHEQKKHDQANEQKRRQKDSFPPDRDASVAELPARSAWNTRKILAETPRMDSSAFRRFVIGSRTVRLEKYFANVGTRVRDRNIRRQHREDYCSATAQNRYLGTPLRKDIGRNTMQMHKVDTKCRHRNLRRAF